MKYAPAILLAFATACATSQVSTETTALQGTWVETLANHPKTFGELLEVSERDGWIALHQHQYEQAYQSFQGKSKASQIGRHRAAEALSALYGEWFELQKYAAKQYVTEAQRRGPNTLSAIGHSLAEKTSDCPTTEQSTEQLKARAIAPVERETSSSGTEVTWFDTCVYAQLSAVWKGRTSPTPSPESDTPAEALARTLFGPGPLHSDPSTIQNLREQILASGVALSNGASKEGLELLHNLGAVPRFEQETLLKSGLHMVAKKEYQPAFRILMDGQGTPNTLGPENSPMLFTAQAKAQLFNGHTRDALNRIAPVTSAYPETRTLLEWMGDLAVLKGLDRQGDSKEN